jgi:hypothetical protein
LPHAVRAVAVPRRAYLSTTHESLIYQLIQSQDTGTQNSLRRFFLLQDLVRRQVSSPLLIQWEYPNERSDPMTLQELQALETADPPKEERENVKSVSVNMDTPVAIRVQQLLEQIKNPYAS